MIFKLKKNKKNLRRIYQTIIKNLPDSIFKKLGLSFFSYMVSNKTIHVYSVNKIKKISAIITVVEYENYIFMNKKILKFLIKNPLMFLLNFFSIFNSRSKKSTFKIKNNYLHLLHLVIIKKNFSNISVKKKDSILNSFYKKILQNHGANVLFLCFDEKNRKAENYYKRNNFKFLNKNENLIYLRKKFF